METSDYEKLGASMDKLRLNDASFSFQSESSIALGFWVSVWIFRVVAYGNHHGTPAA